MGRRPKNDDYPKVRQHKGRARLRILDEEYYCGPWGSPEARAEQDRLIAEFIANGRTAPPQKRPRITRKAATGFQNPGPGNAPYPAPIVVAEPSRPSEEGLEPSTPGVPPLGSGTPQDVIAAKEYATGVTVGEIANLWLDWIERTQCPRGRNRTSLYYGARQAVRALEDFWEFPAASFGCPELTEVQQRLLRTPVVSRPKNPDKKPKLRRRHRTTVNDTIGRIRQLFKWAATRRLIPREVWPVIREDLSLVQPLLRGKCDAPDGPYDRTVDDALVDAVLPALPEVVADLLRFQRLTGCRPGEARGLQLADIDMRRLPAHKGTWVWQVPEWKLSWRERHIPRVIAIGPKAQAILQKWIDRLDGD